MWVDYKPVDVEIDDDNTGVFHVLELRIGTNKFDHRSFLSLFKQQRERPKKFRCTGSTDGALHHHRRGQVSNPRSGLNFSGLSRCCLGRDKKLR